MTRSTAVLCALALSLGAGASTGCVGRAYFTDGTSVSVGRADWGILRDGRRLPDDGPGWVTPPTWRARGLRYGTDELVLAIERAAATVERRYPGGLLGVGDLSYRGGGAKPHHRSHEAGRDADLIYYAVDAEGRPLPPPDAMPRYDRHLRSRRAFDRFHRPVARRYFDLQRNWALVAALLADRTIDVNYIFMARQLRRPLLVYARARGEDPRLLRRAALVLRQPRDSLPHDDHMHVRIRCAPSDIAFGCRDSGPVRLRGLGPHGLRHHYRRRRHRFRRRVA